jgi:hypothetical protein
MELFLGPNLEVILYCIQEVDPSITLSTKNFFQTFSSALLVVTLNNSV